MVCSFLFSSLPMVQPSHAYVIIGMMMGSTICHIACIFIPLNSLSPASEIILAVAPFIFLSISAMWSDKLPLLFDISRKCLYAGTSSSSPFSFRESSIHRSEYVEDLPFALKHSIQPGQAQFEGSHWVRLGQRCREQVPPWLVRKYCSALVEVRGNWSLCGLCLAWVTSRSQV